ncbi:Virulence protein STM3117 [Serratia rubidaea]|uniref:VOC family protein n=1 Tax=Serratia rubidaea TaxID=61652 RepID=A0A448SFS3_SERRU|nr:MULTISPECIES: VOC family protein [Serratia]AGB83672.1 lactoylglutathione lyase-like lyase [Serratia sp. FGI94]AML57334.1 biphenyl-2,3-diol 1,2-dioxygenase III-related protein [Serratia rubidaea]MBD8454283.1 VOC family protein [Serratia rubidaea]MBH1932605.1 VOC family protein [Serratia rubidaea]MBS0974201.1 VOC family protein [Serratia rubidaea]
MKIERLDHLVLTVADIERSCQFYQQVLGFDIITFRGDRKALRFGQQKINLHRQGHEFEPKAHRPTAGSADLCFITSTPLAEVIAELDDLGVIIEEGPVERTGAIGPLLSLYLRDPDNNLLEIANLQSA